MLSRRFGYAPARLGTPPCVSQNRAPPATMCCLEAARILRGPTLSTRMLDRLNDIIVAISSPSGYGPVGIVRLDGPAAVELVDQIAVLGAAEPLTRRPGSTRVAGEIRLTRDVSIPATFYVFRAPHSYTRHDLVEIHTVGSPAVLNRVQRETVRLGARPAEPGEFTARAFLNGAMDLAGAEAVAGVIRAQTDTQLRASRRMMEGRLAMHLAGMRDDLAELLALVEAEIDFAEEPIEFITPDVLNARLGGIADRLATLVAGSTVVEHLNTLPQILLLGPPNAGKSSLMNRLSGTRRAICAAVAGTTRDILSAPIRLRQREAILLDAAGVDDSRDTLMTKARSHTLAAADHVDLVCLVVDISRPVASDVFEAASSLQTGRLVIAANKADLVSAEEAAQCVQLLTARHKGPVCLISALCGTGIEALRLALFEALQSSATTAFQEATLLTQRQWSALSDSLIAVRGAAAVAGARASMDRTDILAFELREALDVLGTVMGEVTTDDLLGRIFASFCIGK